MFNMWTRGYLCIDLKACLIVACDFVGVFFFFAYEWERGTFTKKYMFVICLIQQHQHATRPCACGVHTSGIKNCFNDTEHAQWPFGITWPQRELWNSKIHMYFSYSDFIICHSRRNLHETVHSYKWLYMRKLFNVNHCTKMQGIQFFYMYAVLCPWFPLKKNGYKIKTHSVLKEGKCSLYAF